MDKEEVFASLAMLGEEGMAHKLMVQLDIDGDGQVTFTEFCKGLAKIDFTHRLAVNVLDMMEAPQDALLSEAKLKDLFQEWDRNGTGTLERKELESMTDRLGLNLSERELHYLVNEADVSGTPPPHCHALHGPTTAHPGAPHYSRNLLLHYFLVYACSPPVLWCNIEQLM